MLRTLLLPFLLLTVCCRAAATEPGAPDFAREIRPLLSNHCFQCHGPDDDTREADLRLDTEEGLASAVDRDDPASSEILARILSDDVDLMMPPPDANKALSRPQIQLLKRWVEHGAEWRQHWAFIRPEKPPVPQDDSGWARNEIDAFALPRMQAAGLSPSPEADPWTLVRRVYLDLTGLPPTPEEADNWVARIWPEADLTQPGSLRSQTNEAEWQKLITSLLNSPAWAERWARRWLDLARYADTNGYEKDRERSIWPWRDWVIQSLQDGMPFDQFTIEQIAGDMLPGATQQQLVATGFHRNTMLNEEGGIDPLEFRFHAMTDRVATTGTTWLGLTLGCAQCHTHKYDPVSHREYYQFMALLNNADEPTLRLADSTTQQQNVDRRRRAAELTARLADGWPVTESWRPVRTEIAGVTLSGEETAVIKDGAVLVESAADVATYEVDLRIYDHCDQLVLEGLTPEGRAGPGNTDHGNFVITGIELFAADADGTRQPLAIRSARASVEQSGFAVSGAVDNDAKSGWAVDQNDGPVARSPQAVLVLEEPQVGSADAPVRLIVQLHQNYGSAHTLRAFRLVGAQQDEGGRDEALNEAFLAWWKREQSTAVSWSTLVPSDVRSTLPILEIEADGVIFASGDTAKRDDYWISLPGFPEPVTALRLEALPDERLPAGGPGTTYYEGTIGDFFLNELTLSASETAIDVRAASHSFAKDRYGRPSSAQLAVDGDVQTGWSVHERQGERHTAVFVLQSPIPANTPFDVHMVFGRHFASSLGRFRFSATASDRSPQAHNRDDSVDGLLLRSPDSLTEQERAQLKTAFLLEAPELKKQQDEIRKLLKPATVATSLVMQERPADHPRPTWRHHRGEFLQPKERVEPGILSVLHSLKPGAPADRLALAEWLVSPENPLTPRVVVNRHWEAIFGTGIVRTAEDFGLQGEFPTHRLLLDWLAVTFVEDDDWSLRRLHRRIVSSSLYRQASAVNARAKTSDPDNRLLSYSPRFRLDAEIVRDRLLVASGVLNRRVGGPSVRPPQPGGASEGAYRGSKWTPSEGTERYRRSLYTFARRTAPFAMLTTFDAPSGEACIARRNRSNNPLQALTLLNDVMFTDLARQAGTSIAGGDGSEEERMVRLFRRVLVRPPTATELTSLMAYADRLRQGYTANPELARELTGRSLNSSDDSSLIESAVWTGTARALFALDETVMRE